MKKVLCASITALFMAVPGLSQTCNLALKDGSKMNLNIQTWTNPLTSDSKFLEANDEEKVGLMAAYNADVSSGKIPAASNYPMTYTVKKATGTSAEEYRLGTTIAGKDYFGYVICRNDTLYLCRNIGPVLVGTDDNPYGYTIQGIQKVPMKVKVGDVLPSYDDITISFPSSTDIIVKKNVFSHMKTTQSNELGFGTYEGTDRVGYGMRLETSTRAVYNTIDVNVRETLTSSGHTINFMNAKVTGEEEVTVSGVKYKAAIIESEFWSKSTLNASYESADEEVNKEQREHSEKLQGKMETMMIKKQVTNKLGYTVMYKKEWFVPQMGMVKTQAYDLFGGIANLTSITGLE